MPHTSITKPQFVTSIRTTGGGRDLPKGQLAIVKDKASASGAVVVSDFAGMSKKERIEIRVGVGELPSGLRAQHVAFEGTGFFPLEGIIDIKGYAPTHVELKVDKLEIGYGGMSGDEGLFIPEGKSAVMDVVIYGHPMAMFFGQKEHIITKRVYRKEGQTMQEVVKQLVIDLQNESVPTTMPGFASINDKLSNYLNISLIDSSADPLSGTAWKTSSVEIEDAGESNDLAAVQALYPAYKVVRTGREDRVTTYSILHLDSVSIANAVLTTTDVTGKGCEDCQSGYSTLTGGVVYHLELEDDGVTQVALVDDLPGYVAGTVLRIGSDAGKGIYSVVVDNELTDAEKATFLAVSAISSTASFRKLGNVDTVCSKTSTKTYVWSEGSACYAQTKNFSIVLPDNDCGDSRLTEIQLAYPELTITEGVEGTEGGCKRIYNTTVATNVVCADCDDIFTNSFVAEAPKDFENISWEQEAEVFDEDAKMGIKIEGKPFNLVPETYEQDWIPFIETSTKIKSASFGFREQDYLNFVPAYDVNTELATVRRISTATDVNNLSQSFFGAEAMGRQHYQNETQFKGNLFARANFSQESLLKYQKRMVSYHIKYQDTSLSQMGGGRSNITHDFMIVVEQGKHQGIETVLNKLAGRLGLENVSITN